MNKLFGNAHIKNCVTFASSLVNGKYNVDITDYGCIGKLYLLKQDILIVYFSMSCLL